MSLYVITSIFLSIEKKCLVFFGSVRKLVPPENMTKYANELKQTLKQTVAPVFSSLCSYSNECYIVQRIGDNFGTCCTYLVVFAERRGFRVGLGKRWGLRVFKGDAVNHWRIDPPFVTHCGG